jgi:membrane carboxypeptidase/penicillin-binding protein
LNLSRPAAVKTGTTEDYRDSLTLGYTPSLTVGVWVGNNDNTIMEGIAGSSGAAPIWRSLMEHFLLGTPIERFVRPLGINAVSICRQNGLKANVATSSAYLEFFLNGTEPTKNCTEVEITPQISEAPKEQPTQVQSTIQPTEKPTDEPKPTKAPKPTDEPKATATIPLPTIGL